LLSKKNFAGWPLLCCVLAGLALSFTPIVIARIKIGMWALLQPEVEYYLQIAGQAYYNHLSYISDPSVPDGNIFYPWLPFGPAVGIARALGLSLFSVGPIWMLFGAVGTSAGLYFVFWRFLGRPWTAAALSIFCLSSLRFSASIPLNYQFHAILRGLLHPYGNIDLSPIPIWEWRRVVDPAFDLPFLFAQIVVVSIARERQKGVSVWLSGLVFGLMFYVYFYMWTLVTAALCLAMLLDTTRRTIYAQTLLIGLALGAPEVVHLFRLRQAASIEAMTRFAAFSAAGSEYLPSLPWLSIIVVGVVGLWIWTTGAPELTYLWSLAAAGILLGCSPLLTGAFLHAYHWTWLMLPIRMILALIMIATIAKERLPWLPAFNWAAPVLLTIYLAGGIYLTAITLARTADGVGKIENYSKYRSQRLVAGVNPLAPNSVIAGDDRFSELAAIGENQRALSGVFLNASMSVDDATWRSRFSLNAFLNGTTDRLEFERAASIELETGLWNAPKITPELIAPFMRTYDDVVRDPDRFIRTFAVRYVALPVDRPQPLYLRSGWTLVQPGPYWQLWERKD
jgi:hypothetical protein